MDREGFRKSSFCTDATSCVEVLVADDHVQVRDERGVEVQFTHGEWSAFVAGVKADEFDV